MKEERAKKYIKELSACLDIKKCRECECLNGALTQLKIDLPGLSKELDRIISRKVHGCIGCAPCAPADVWERYLKEKG